MKSDISYLKNVTKIVYVLEIVYNVYVCIEHNSLEFGKVTCVDFVCHIYFCHGVVRHLVLFIIQAFDWFDF